jgi:hypothetical protein
MMDDRLMLRTIGILPMVFSMSLGRLTVLERELREWANFANFQGFIRAIRGFAAFALKISRLVESRHGFYLTRRLVMNFL